MKLKFPRKVNLITFPLVLILGIIICVCLFLTVNKAKDQALVQVDIVSEKKEASPIFQKIENNVENARQRSRYFFSFEWAYAEKIHLPLTLDSLSVFDKIGDEERWHDVATFFDWKKKRPENIDLSSRKTQARLQKIEEGYEEARQKSVRFFSFQWIGSQNEAQSMVLNYSPPLIVNVQKIALLACKKCEVFLASEGISSENTASVNMKAYKKLMQKTYKQFDTRTRQSESYKQITPKLLEYSDFYPTKTSQANLN